MAKMHSCVCISFLMCKSVCKYSYYSSMMNLVGTLRKRSCSATKVDLYTFLLYQSFAMSGVSSGFRHHCLNTCCSQYKT